MNKSVHPSVQQFREFINKHPKLRKEIRKQGRSWQEYYEKWILLGEEDEYWHDYKEENKDFKEEKEKGNQEFLGQIMKYLDKVDVEKVQQQVHQLSGTISTVQLLLDQYQGNKKASSPRENNPFSLFRD